MNTSLTPKNLEGYHIKLASGSPRRRELLELLGLEFEVVTTHDVEENVPADLDATRRPEYLSIAKAAAYYDELTDRDLLITADTMVICDGEALGKPADAADARKMLRKLSGKTHSVVTGVTVCSREVQVSFSVTTYVSFTRLADSEIDTYVERFRPLDKAGAYGIQEWIGAIAISGIDGSYYNVMGLPVHYLYDVLKHFRSLKG